MGSPSKSKGGLNNFWKKKRGRGRLLGNQEYCFFRLVFLYYFSSFQIDLEDKILLKHVINFNMVVKRDHFRSFLAQL